MLSSCAWHWHKILTRCDWFRYIKTVYPILWCLHRLWSFLERGKSKKWCFCSQRFRIVDSDFSLWDPKDTKLCFYVGRSCRSWILNFCCVARSWRPWILFFCCAVGSQWSWILAKHFWREILQILDLKILFCGRILWILNPVFFLLRRMSDSRNQ